MEPQFPADPRAAAAIGRAVMDAQPDPVLVMSSTGSLLSCNAAAREVLAIESGGANALAHLPMGVRESILACQRHALASPAKTVPEDGPPISLQRAGKDCDFLPHGVRVDGESGNAVAAVVTLRDASRLRLADDLKIDLVATVAHELRTPLTSLHMSIHLCLEQSAGPLTAEQGILLSSAREDCERLRLLVNELLDMGRLASGRLTLDQEPTEPEELAQRAYSSFRTLAQDKGVALDIAVPGWLGLVNADRERVHRVFSNLLSNALRHTPVAGAIAIKASRDGPFCRFEVSDTGDGIPPEYQNQVFEKFVRGPNKTKHGLGLGLCIARDIIAAHGGQIGVISAVGKGSSFWFTLPILPGAGRPLTPT
jgi:two-component system, NtrC family, sensor histidine kinase KinB